MLFAEPFRPEGKRLDGLFPIEGAITVTQEQRVGRLIGDKVEWIGQIPKGGIALGYNFIRQVGGRYPDQIDVLYTTASGRAPEPTYMALTGKGTPVLLGEGGSGAAQMTGVATAGENTFVIGYSQQTGHQIYTVRGPAKVTRTSTPPAKAGCKPGEVRTDEFIPMAPAIAPEVIGGTPAGTLMTFGNLCEKRELSAEIWDASGASRIVDVSQWIQSAGFGSRIFPGKGDELWIFAYYQPVILHYKDGNFEPLPSAEIKGQNAYMSASNELYMSDDQVVRRYDGSKWSTVARLAFRPRFYNIAVDNGTIWGSDRGNEVFRLREGPDTEIKDDCKTPFVFLYDVSSDNAPNFTFPTTRKALSTFAGVDELGLVEFNETGARRLGITVTSRAQGEAVIAHVKANMKDEKPSLICYAPKEPRKIDIKKGK